MTQAQIIVGKDRTIIGLALLPPDVRCEDGDNRWIHLLRSDKFESHISNRRGGNDPNRVHKLCNQELLAIAEKFNGPAEAATDALEYIKTRHGTIRIKKLPNGHYALRNQSNPDLINTVRALVRGSSGWWNPKYHNWVVPPEVMENIRTHFEADKKLH
jgi:hypothetical protein